MEKTNRELTPYTDKRKEKSRDRGYLIVYLLYALFAGTILFALFMEY